MIKTIPYLFTDDGQPVPLELTYDGDETVIDPTSENLVQRDRVASILGLKHITDIPNRDGFEFMLNKHNWRVTRDA